MNAWKLSTKLISGFAVVAIITLIVGFVGLYSIIVTSKDIKEIGTVRLSTVTSLLILAEAQTAIDSAENALLNRDLDQKGRESKYRDLEAIWKRADKAWKVYESLPHTTAESSIWKEFVPAWQAWKNDYDAYLILSKKYDQSKSDLDFAELSQQALFANAANYSKAAAMLTMALDITNKEAEATVKAAQTKAIILKIAVIGGMLTGAAVALVFGILLSLSIIRPINRVAEGLTDGANQVSTAAGQVASSSQSLAEGTSEQASSLEETSASLEEMSSMSRQNSDNARQAQAMMGEASRIVQKVSLHMDDMSTAIAEITRSSEETGKIIKTIDEIAFQTNLLALNAAVEAARAGEAGAGFAVVADEVRNLAMRASDAAKNTNDLIENTIKAVHKGNELTSATREAFKENITISGKIGQLIEEISAATEEQSHGITQVNLAVSEMDKITQSTAASSEESAAAAEELTAQAGQMKSFVEDLAMVIRGSANGHLASSVKNDRVSRDAKAKIPKMHSAHKALALSEKKTFRQHTDASRASQKPASAEQLIPFNDGDFKDF